MTDDATLERVLTAIQRRGGIGRGPVHEAVAHARRFVECLPGPSGVLVDLGSGGGLPALVIAVDAPGWYVHLVERRQKRVDLLGYGVQALGLPDRVEVHGDDVERFTTGHLAVADVVTARSFAPPLAVVRTALPLLRRPGLVLVSDPPDGAPRWSPDELVQLGVQDRGALGGIRRFLVP